MCIRCEKRSACDAPKPGVGPALYTLFSTHPFEQPLTSVREMRLDAESMVAC